MITNVGGSILGEGTYGCVFHPPIKCDYDKKRRSGVGKVIQNMYDAQEEIQIGKKLLKIDPNGKFTNPMMGDCIITKKNITNKDEGNLICGLTSTLNEFKTYKQIIYKYKGEDLLVAKTKGLTNFINIIEGLQVLQKSNICHRDIKEQNILFVKKKYILIDFGLSLQLNEVFTFNEHSILMFDYMYYPPEFKIIAIMEYLKSVTTYHDTKILVDAIYTNMNKHNFIHQYKYLKPVLKELGIYKDIRLNVYNAIYKIVNDTYKMTDIQRKKYLTNLAKFADIFSLGVVILNESKQAELTSYKQIQIHAIIKKTIHFDVFNRYTIDELLNDFKHFVGNTRSSNKCINNFTLNTLRSIAKTNNVRTSGNKHDIYDRVSSFIKGYTSANLKTAAM